MGEYFFTLQGNPHIEKMWGLCYNITKEGEIMIVKAEQIEVLKPYIENIEDLIAEGDVQAVLDAIDDVIVDNILGNDDEPDDEGIKLQKIYDEIFDQN